MLCCKVLSYIIILKLARCVSSCQNRNPYQQCLSGVLVHDHHAVLPQYTQYLCKFRHIYWLHLQQDNSLPPYT